MEEQFRASRWRDPITPDEVRLSDKGVTFKVKKLLGGSESFVFYEDISGVEIDHGIFFSTIKIMPRARPEIEIHNFWRRDARKVKDLILRHVNSKPNPYQL